MPYATLYFTCIACGRPDMGNPYKIPSITITFVNGTAVPDPSGSREPRCQLCAHRLNEIRLAKGLEPFPIPPDAYESWSYPDSPGR